MGERPFDVIAFDGDDTLWHNERHYVEARDRFRGIVSRSGVSLDDQALTDEVNRTEIRNIPYFGYGVSSFTLSLIEAALAVTGGGIPGAEIANILALAKSMLTTPVELFEGAREALEALAPEYPLVLITKGDLLHQRSKLERSGLAPHFEQVEVVSHKTPEVFSAILERRGVHPSRFLMVGNSPRSDVLPVLRIGGWAVHVPAALTWDHEEETLDCRSTSRCRVLRTLLDLPNLVRNWGPASAA